MCLSSNEVILDSNAGMDFSGFTNVGVVVPGVPIESRLRLCKDYANKVYVDTSFPLFSFLFYLC